MSARRPRPRWIKPAAIAALCLAILAVLAVGAVQQHQRDVRAAAFCTELYQANARADVLLRMGC